MSFDLLLTDSDLGLRRDGAIKTVDKSNKLKQDIVKMIVTPITSVKYHLWYGSAISDKLIGEMLPENMLFQTLSSSITDSLKKLQKLQRAQATSQRVSLSEILGTIKEVLVQRSATDPRQVNVIVSVMSKDFNSVEEVFTISP